MRWSNKLLSPPRIAPLLWLAEVGWSSLPPWQSKAWMAKRNKANKKDELAVFASFWEHGLCRLKTFKKICCMLQPPCYFSFTSQATQATKSKDLCPAFSDSVVNQLCALSSLAQRSCWLRSWMQAVSSPAVRSHQMKMFILVNSVPSAMWRIKQTNLRIPQPEHHYQWILNYKIGKRTPTGRCFFKPKGLGFRVRVTAAGSKVRGTECCLFLRLKV